MAVQTSSTPTQSETTELPSTSLPGKESGVVTESTSCEALDTESSVESHEPKNDNDDVRRTEGQSNRTDNEVDEGVDLQGTAGHVNKSNVVQHWMYSYRQDICHHSGQNAVYLMSSQ